MSTCAFCGRDNDAASHFCIDCGKPLPRSAARIPARPPHDLAPAARAVPAARVSDAGGRAHTPTAAVPPTHAPPAATPAVASCAACGARIDPTLPFCPWCGGRTGAAGGGGTARRVDVTAEAGAVVLSSSARIAGPRLAVLDEAGTPTRSFVIESGDLTIGRAAGDVLFPDDEYLSPIHAQFSWRGGELVVRDLGSRNGTWAYLDAPHRLCDGDVLLVGSQLLRFRRLGYPGPRTPDADRTRPMGSFTPSVDVAVLQQLRGDGSTRDAFHLAPGRAVFVGRGEGDWVFPYDGTMSARHAEIRSEDAEFVVHDCGSRNGVALAVRGDRPLRPGQRVLLGDHTLRVESP